MWRGFIPLPSEVPSRTAQAPLAGGIFAMVCVAVTSCGQIPPASQSGTANATTSPIKKVIVLIGENRSFDHVFGTYVARPGQSVSNLLSKGIVTADGKPGPHADLARQFQLNSVAGTYFISAGASNKTPYVALPPPNTSVVPAVGVTLPQVVKDRDSVQFPLDASSFTARQLQTIVPALPAKDLPLLTTGGTGLSICNVSPTQVYPTYPPQGCHEIDKRVANYAALPNTAFPLTGPSLPYDSYTGEAVHRFFPMWQQSSCDAQAATATDPAGCRKDLYVYVDANRKDGTGSNSMGFHNMQAGDAPVLKQLADEYAMSDNYHQPVMGGTFVQHMMLVAGDVLFWEIYKNQAGVTLTAPPAAEVANPDPKGPADVSVKSDKAWTACADLTKPGIRAIHDYLAALPWRPDRTASNCEPGRYYAVNNVYPAYKDNGDISDTRISEGLRAPPSSLRSIGDVLNERNITWAYYGGGYHASVQATNGATDPIELLAGDDYCDLCNPFQYSMAIMGNPAQRQAHIKDATDFFEDLCRGALPAVAFVKPGFSYTGLPTYSKVDLFEALVERIYGELQANPKLFEETALFVTFDESGGYWDSGFIQPIDFFGDGPRIPFIVVSPYARGGRVIHTYADHVSILKFVERNWNLPPITARSRDNLPNPTPSASSPYLPTNMPAIGDLFDLFQFPRN
jgi:phospholipase C